MIKVINEELPNTSTNQICEKQYLMVIIFK